MWSMLGARPVTLLAWESFGEGWVTDVVKQLKLDATVIKADYGELPDLAAVDPAHDVVFTWNGTTSGVRVPDGDWISDDREGLTIADATSAVFAQDLPWDKIDVATFSWQKVLGGEGGHGMLDPRPARGRAAGELHAALAAAQDLPDDQERQADRGHLRGRDDQHAVDAGGRGLYLRARMGGRGRRPARPDRPLRGQCRGGRRLGRADRLDRASRRRPGDPLEHQRLPASSPRRGDPEAQAALVKKMAGLLEAEGVGYDLASYRDAPPGLALWCGATVDTDDLEALFPWLDWAFHEARAPDPVIPAEAGTSGRKDTAPFTHEVPAFAGMTEIPMPKVLISDPDGPEGRGDLPRQGGRGRRKARPVEGRAEGDHRRL